MTEFEVVENLLGQHVCTGWPFWCQKRQSTKIMMKKNRLLETENCFMTGETYGSSAVTRTPNRRPRLWEIFFRVKAGKSHFYLFSPIILIHFCETLTPTRKIGTEARGESSPNLDSLILFRKLQNFLVFLGLFGVERTSPSKSTNPFFSKLSPKSGTALCECGSRPEARWRRMHGHNINRF